MERKVIIDKANNITQNLLNKLDLSHKIEISDTLNKGDEYYFGMTSYCKNLLERKFGMRIHYGNFQKESDQERIDNFYPALEFFVRHEIGHRVKKSDRLVKEVYSEMDLFRKEKWGSHIFMWAKEVIIDKIALTMDNYDNKVIDSFVYTSRRSFKELAQKNLPISKNLVPDRFFHFAQMVAVLESLGESQTSKEIRKFIEKHSGFNKKRRIGKVIGAYKKIYTNNVFNY